MAWFAPAVGAAAYEVGPELRSAFLKDAGNQLQAVEACFATSETRAGHFYADLYALARLRLEAMGVTQVFGGAHCTFTESERFYSYRRDGETGRMASLIMMRH